MKALKCKFHQAVQVKNQVLTTVDAEKHNVTLEWSAEGLKIDWEGNPVTVLIPSYNCFEVHLAKKTSK